MDYRHGRHSVYASGGVSIGAIVTPSPYGADSPWYLAPTAVNGLSTGGSGSARDISDDNPYIHLGDIGGIQVNADPAQGLPPGVGQGASNYGTHNMNTFDPHQMTLELRLRF
jgi:hypothetical protein